MSRSISLTQGKAAIVDDADYVELMRYKWHAWRNGDVWYAIRREHKNGRRVYMHHEVLRAKHLIDHVNRDGLDNRRENLRPATKSQNAANAAKARKIVTSRFKGVSWLKTRSAWRAVITVDQKQHHLGYCKNEIDAAALYDEAARKYFGGFAFLNLGAV